MRYEVGQTVLFQDILNKKRIGKVTKEKYDEQRSVFYYRISVGTEERKQMYYGITQNKILEVLK